MGRAGPRALFSVLISCQHYFEIPSLNLCVTEFKKEKNPPCINGVNGKSKNGVEFGVPFVFVLLIYCFFFFE